MEIFSYVGANAAVQKNTPRKMNFQPLYAKDVYRPFDFDKSEKREKIQRAVNKLGNSKLSFAVSVILTILIFSFVPYYTFNVLSYFESHTSPLKFQLFQSELDVLDAQMEKFAIERTDESFDENGNVVLSDGTVLSPAIVNVAEPVTFKNYTVKSGDTISSIALKFGLTNISTLIGVNEIGNVRTLRAGQKLKVPSVDGLTYKVRSGDSLNSLSVKFNIAVEEILDANDLSSDSLSVGTSLFIPGAKMDSASLKKAMGELFVYPITAPWRLTSKFGPRADPFSGVATSHTGIDMACPQGTPIRAALSGKVVLAGWSNVFGNYVIINHGNGYQSLYGHMVKYYVKKDQYVDQNTKIGLVGSTGYSTGPHLHFTVYKNGKLVDPMSLIK